MYFGVPSDPPPPPPPPRPAASQPRRPCAKAPPPSGAPSDPRRYSKQADSGAHGEGAPVNDPRNNQHNPRYANYWAPLTHKRHLPQPAQPHHTNHRIITGVLLEILSQASDPQAIQPHMESLFDGIATVLFEKQKATANAPACLKIMSMTSQEGEEVRLNTPVAAFGNVEDWLNKLCDTVIGTIKEIVRQMAVECMNITNNVTILRSLIDGFPAQVPVACVGRGGWMGSACSTGIRWPVCATGAGAHKGQTSREGERDIWWTVGTTRGGTGHLGLTHAETQRGRLWRGALTAKTVKRPRQQPAQLQYANYWAPVTRKRYIPPHPAQPQHTKYWAPRTRKRHQQEHRPQRPTESSDPTQHAKGRTGDRPGPRKGATTRRNVTQGGGGQCGARPVARCASTRAVRTCAPRTCSLTLSSLERTLFLPPVCATYTFPFGSFRTAWIRQLFRSYGNDQT